MVFRNFHTALVLRVLALSLTIFVSVFLFLGTGFYVTAAVSVAFAVYQIWALTRSIDKTNEELTRFLYAERSQS